MTAIDLQNLIHRLDANARLALENAAGLSVRNGHAAIELAHWLAAAAASESGRAALDAGGDLSARVEAEATRAVSDLPRGRGGTPAFAQSLIELFREAWVHASLNGGRERVSMPDLVLALASDANLRALACAVAPAFRQLNRAAVEALAAAIEPAPDVRPAGSAPGPRAPGSEDFLALYARDLTADAEAGRIDPVIGRDAELRQSIDILLRRRQNNPILVGEAGVGKTAVAEALARAVVAGEVPEKLRGVRLLALDLSLLQAGAGVKGEFERRLTGVVDAVKASVQPIILFIDEAHGLVGAGNQPGQGDAANILKPALARGELRTVAATTWSEYKRHIERDPALTRRFQPVKVEEPDEETAVRMLRGLAPSLEAHHGVKVRDEALAAAVRLSARYIPARQLPDKAISLIDTAAAFVAFSREAEPAPLANLRRERETLQLEAERLGAEPGGEAAEQRLGFIARRLEGIADEIAELEARVEAERALLSEADVLEAGFPTDAASRPSYDAVAGKLADLQGEAPLLHRVVDAEAVAAVVARWTGVPVGRLISEDVETVGRLSERLKARIVGQDAAIDAVVRTMRVSRAGLSDPRRPPGVFLMVGMSGVGKTETALALADLLYGGPQYLTTINMSEFKEEHKVSMLVGSPPGYVGFGEGGVLTEAVRRRPYGVLLLDEMDKAHPGVQDVFYQLFDKGSLRDGEGRDIDFRHTTILMTANTGSDVLAALAADPETMPDEAALGPLLRPALLAQFKPAFLGRTTVLPFRPLTREALDGIVELQLGRVAARVAANHGGRLTVAPAARDALRAAAELGDTGARAIEATIASAILPALADHFLDAVASGHARHDVEVDHTEGAFTARARSPQPSIARPATRRAKDAGASKRPAKAEKLAV